MRKDLDKLCEEMRLRNLARGQVDGSIPETNAEQKPLCANCKRRVCRRGSPLCSRCTYKGIQSKLRDTLPGAVKLDDVERKLDGRKTAVEEANDEVVGNLLYGQGAKSDLNFDGLLQPEGDPELKRFTEVPKFSTEEEEAQWWDDHKDEVEEHTAQVHEIENALDGKIRHYTRKEVSKMVGVSPTTIIRWERKGVIPLPKRFAHNNQLIYTDEIVATIKEYANQIIVTQYVPLPPKTPQELAARGTTTRKTFKINKKLERAVAQRVSVTGFRGAGKLA